jgi:F0F1-type ATP synthase assembly protein I
MNDKDYAAMTLEELLAAQQKIKKAEFLSAIAVGFLVGVMVFGLIKKGFGILYIVILGVLIAGVFKNSRNMKQKAQQIQAAIDAKSKT